jgi:hypothetical protein
MSSLLAGSIGFVAGIAFCLIVRALLQRFVNGLSGAIWGWRK